MNGHPDARYWRHYADGGLREDERAEAECHLADCDRCRTMYVDMLAANAGAMGAAGRLTAIQADELTGRIMGAVGELAKNRGAEIRRTKRRRQAIVHYVIAVCVMLLLMSAGVFERLAEQPLKWQADRSKSGTEPLSSSLVKRTSAVIDSIIDKPLR